MTMQTTEPTKVSQTDVSSLTTVGNAMTAALGELAAGRTTVELPKEALEAMANILPGHTPADAQPVERVSATLTSTKREYKDNRPGFSDHPAVDFHVTLSRPESAREVLKALLGDDADVLISDWGDRLNLDQVAPVTSTVTLFLDSNNKARNRDYANRGDKTTQEEDFKSAGLAFGNDLQATIICAALVNKAKGSDKLSAGETDLLSKLRPGGVVRVSSGSLAVWADGRLRSRYTDSDGRSGDWAFGGGLRSPGIK